MLDGREQRGGRRAHALGGGVGGEQGGVGALERVQLAQQLVVLDVGYLGRVEDVVAVVVVFDLRAQLVDAQLGLTELGLLWIVHAHVRITRQTSWLRVCVVVNRAV